MRLVQAAVVARDATFDAAESMLGRHVGGACNHHSALRDKVVHPTRDSLDYALMLPTSPCATLPGSSSTRDSLDYALMLPARELGMAGGRLVPFVGLPLLERRRHCARPP